MVNKLFEFTFKELSFTYVLIPLPNTAACRMEVHAKCTKGEEFLCSEDNYNDCFFEGRKKYIELRTKEMQDAIVQKT